MSTQRAPNENEDELSLDSGGEEPTGGNGATGGPNGSGAGAGVGEAGVDAVDDTIMDNDYDNINERIKQIEQEAQMIREMQNEVEKQFNTSTSTASGSPGGQFPTLEEKMLQDSRSVYVGNVDYSATPDQLEEHFRGCGAIERVTILTDKFSGHPKGFAYVQFDTIEGMQNALSMSESLFLGRQIKVVAKRTNRPGVSSTNRPPFRGRGGRGRVIVKYIYPGRGRGRPRRRGFSPY